MAYRSRTQLFFRYRESLKTHRKGPRTTLELHELKVQKNLLGAHGPASDDESSQVDARVYSIPPVWVTVVDDLNRDISTIKIKISDLATLSGKHLLPSFDDDDDNAEQIAGAVQEIATLFKECERRLKDISSCKHEGAGDEKVRENIQQRVAKQLQDLSIEFRRGHKAYLAKLKGQEIAEYRPDFSMGGGGARTGIGAAGSSGSFFDDEPEQFDSACVDPRFSVEQTMQLAMAERMTEEREKAINSVAESVTELAEIFKEVQYLVIDQGTILDRIDFNIEQAADRVGAAVGELNKANNYQKKSRTMLCIYLLLLLCALMVIILIMKKTMAR